MRFFLIRRNINLFLITVFFILFSACNKENCFDCLKSTGKIITEDRKPGDFNSIEIHGIFNVYITQDSVCRISIEGGKNLLPKITTECNHNTLIIENNNYCNWVRSFDKEINVYISVSTLEELDLYAYNEVFSTNTLIMDTIDIEIHTNAAKLDLTMNCSMSLIHIHAATGDYYLRGSTEHNYIYSCGFGYVFAADFSAKIAHVVNKSTGDVYVNATEQLWIEKIDGGDVYYTGNPPVILLPEDALNGKLLPIN